MSEDSLRNIKGVLFDLDETLIDALKGLEAAQKAVIHRICNQLPCEKTGMTSREIRQKLSEFDDRMNLERKYDRNQWWQQFVNEIGINVELGESQIKELTQTYWDNYVESATPFPEARPVLGYLNEKGYSLGLVTDTDGSGIPKRERISRFDFSKLFETIVVGGRDTPKSKPDPESFKQAIQELGLKPNECVMVGDKPFTDIKGAKTVGMPAVLLRRRDWGMEENPDFVVNNLTDLRELL